MTGQEIPPKEWILRTSEDVLLDQYWRERGGHLYLEVPIGGPGGAGEWPSGCTIRRLDAVLFPNAETLSVARYHSAVDKFAQDFVNHELEVIEVKPSLNRTAIGQAIAGRRMFHRQYKAVVPRTVILCRSVDSALAWVCGEERVDIETR